MSATRRRVAAGWLRTFDQPKWGELRSATSEPTVSRRAETARSPAERASGPPRRPFLPQTRSSLCSLLPLHTRLTTPWGSMARPSSGPSTASAPSGMYARGPRANALAAPARLFRPCPGADRLLCSAASAHAHAASSSLVRDPSRCPFAEDPSFSRRSSRRLRSGCASTAARGSPVSAERASDSRFDEPVQA